jgi:hypothetical protein
MAVGVQLDFHGVTLEPYDVVVARTGLLFGCFRVIDVWPSRETFESFAERTLVPTCSETGVTDQPDTRFFEVHNTDASDPWRG